MELILVVELEKDNSFTVYRRLQELVWMRNSIIKVDYKYTPWHRVGGNLLW
jgi:hypothetical protein